MFIQAPERDKVGYVHFQMDKWGDRVEGEGRPVILITRERGVEARHALERELDLHPRDDEPVGIDFSDVVALSVSFADGFFVQLLSGWQKSYYGGHPLVVFGASPDVADTIDAVLRLRMLGVLHVKSKNDETLLGGESSLQETMRVAAQLRIFTAHELADVLHLKAPAANNRLKALVDMGALIREPITPRQGRGGKEFRYRIPEVPPPLN